MSGFNQYFHGQSKSPLRISHVAQRSPQHHLLFWWPSLAAFMSPFCFFLTCQASWHQLPCKKHLQPVVSELGCPHPLATDRDGRDFTSRSEHLCSAEVGAALAHDVGDARTCCWFSLTKGESENALRRDNPERTPSPDLSRAFHCFPLAPGRWLNHYTATG